MAYYLYTTNINLSRQILFLLIIHATVLSFSVQGRVAPETRQPLIGTQAGNPVDGETKETGQRSSTPTRGEPVGGQPGRTPSAVDGGEPIAVAGMSPAQSPALYPVPAALPHHRGASLLIGIIIGTVSGVILTMIAAITALRRLKSPSSQATKHRNVEKFLLQHGSLTPKRYTYSQLNKITNSFTDKLGQGGYGSVYKGMLPDGCPVAVKLLRHTTDDTNGEEFMNEVASISRTSHVNIVALLGFCHDRKKRALVYEFMPNSSLDKLLNNNQSDLEKLYKIAIGIAKGLDYLHAGCTTRIVHFDIKPQNILLDQDLCPKISDFGLAKLCKKRQSTLSVEGLRGTFGYIAPEVYSRNFGRVSHKSDVYSYGMMLLQMAGAKKVTQAEAIQSSENYFPDKIYEEVISDIDHDLMMEGEEEKRQKMFLVGFWCIQTMPSNRPSISKVVEMLEGRSIEIPPMPLLCPPLIPSPNQQTSSSHADADQD